MAGMPPETRVITDELDEQGNTTAAIGKGFAKVQQPLPHWLLFLLLFLLYLPIEQSH